MACQALLLCSPCPQAACGTDRVTDGATQHPANLQRAKICFSKQTHRKLHCKGWRRREHPELSWPQRMPRSEQSGAIVTVMVPEGPWLLLGGLLSAPTALGAALPVKQAFGQKTSFWGVWSASEQRLAGTGGPAWPAALQSPATKGRQVHRDGVG